MALESSIWNDWPTSVILHYSKEKLSVSQVEATFRKRYIWGFFVKLFLRIILVPVLLISSIPLVNLFHPAVLGVSRIIYQWKQISLSDILGILFFGTAPFMVFHTSAILSVQIIQRIAYTFIGILLNYDTKGKTSLALVVIIVFAMNRSANFTSKYYLLLRKVIEKAQEVDNGDNEMPDRPHRISYHNEICSEPSVVGFNDIHEDYKNIFRAKKLDKGGGMSNNTNVVM